MSISRRESLETTTLAGMAAGTLAATSTPLPRRVLGKANIQALDGFSGTTWMPDRYARVYR